MNTYFYILYRTLYFVVLLKAGVPTGVLTSHNVLEEIEIETSSIAINANQPKENQFDLEFEQCMSTIEAQATVVPIVRDDGQWAVKNIIGESFR